MSSTRDIAEAIFEARNYPKKAHRIDEYDRETFIDQIAMEAVPEWAAVDDGKWAERLVAHHGMNRDSLAMRAGRCLRQIALSEHPDKTCEQLIKKAHPDTSRGIPACRWPVLQVIHYRLNSELPEPYTLGELWWEFDSRTRPNDLLWAGVQTRMLAGAYFLTFRQMMGWSRHDFGEAAGLYTRKSASGSTCQALGSWERGQADSPGRNYAEKLRTFAESFDTYRERLDVVQ